MTVDTLQRVFKTLHDPTRVRILGLLEREELAVQDLTEVLGMAQSTVSRHLALLKEAGLISDRREGTFVYYRFPAPGDPQWRSAWQLAHRALDDDPVGRRDQDALATVLEARATRARRWFDDVGPEWDRLRKVFDDDTQRARAISRIVPPGIKVADIGTGTGTLALELAALGLQVIAIDHSERMLEVARQNFAAAPANGIDVRLGEISDLPLGDGEVHAVFTHMVLHYVPSPQDAIFELARVIEPGGKVIIADFVQHDREWMRKQLGVLWQGFDPDQVREWFADAKLEDFHLDIQESRVGSGKLPATFIATGIRSGESAKTRSAP